MGFVWSSPLSKTGLIVCGLFVIVGVAMIIAGAVYQHNSSGNLQTDIDNAATIQPAQSDATSYSAFANGDADNSAVYRYFYIYNYTNLDALFGRVLRMKRR